MIIYYLYIVCGHRTFEKRVFLHFVLWVHISITLAPNFCDVVVIVYSPPATKYIFSWPIIVDNYSYVCKEYVYKNLE